jgi:antitoxin component YwqK of YwqJK toxin-antitoxin module
MKNLAFLILCPLIFLCSCAGPLEEEIVETHPDGSPKLVRLYKVDGQIRTLKKEIQYYPNHQKLYEGELKDNRKHGKWTVWHQNGNTWSEGYYSNGVDDGRRTGYHENGQKHFQGKYKNGKMAGTWKFWDDTGVKVNEIKYD